MIAVTVSAPATVSISGVAVVGESPFGLSGTTETSLPADFSFTVPATAACRRYLFSAMGVTSAGQRVTAEPILIDVEPPDVPRMLSTQMREIYFRVTGDISPITLTGTFPDGKVLKLTESSRVTYATSNPSVATVDKNGLVTAGAPGQASITARYRLENQTVSVVIPVDVAAQALSPSRFAVRFADQVVGTRSPSQQITITNTSQGAFDILGIRAGGEFAQTNDCPAARTLEPAASCTITVTFTPAAVGARVGTLSIENNATTAALAIPLTGTGIR